MRYIFLGIIGIGFAVFHTSCTSNATVEKSKSQNIDTLVINYPDSVPLLIRHGRYYYGKYNYEKAMASAAKAFRLDSNNLDARLLYANVLNNRPNRTIEEIFTARRHFQVVHKKRPKDTETLISLASTYTVTQDFEKSFQYINEALRINPKYRDGYVLKGTNYMQLGDIKLAKSSYETAVQQDPKFYEGYLFLAKLYDQEENPICLEYYRTAAEVAPVNLEVLYNLAYALQSYDKVEEAKEVYGQMIRLDSDYAMPDFQLGWIKQFKENEIDSAEYYYNRAINIEPRFVEAWHNMGMIHESRGDKSLALKAYAKALKYNPNFALSREAADRLR